MEVRGGEWLARKLARLREGRKKRKQAQKRAPVAVRRRSLSAEARRVVLAKTAERCHICGGPVGEDWQADHVLAHSAGGPDSPDNYLAAHRLCNTYRWDFSDEEFRCVLKLGVWARTQIERRTELGSELAEKFMRYERAREGRRRGRRRP